MSVLETHRLILRRWRPEDLEPFARLNADPRVMEHFPSTQTLEETRASIDRIEAHIDRHGFGFWACEIKETGALAGFIGLKVPTFDPKVLPAIEIGWRLAHEYWGRGYAPEGAIRALEFAFGDLKAPEVIAITAVANAKSRRVMEKIGMEYDPNGDFDHPDVPVGNRVRRHVLYRIKPR